MYVHIEHLGNLQFWTVGFSIILTVGTVQNLLCIAATSVL